jgi:hypothetical protein
LGDALATLQKKDYKTAEAAVARRAVESEPRTTAA